MTETTDLTYRGVKIIAAKSCPKDAVYLMALSDEQIKQARKFGIDVKKIDPKKIAQVKNVKI